MRNTTQCLFLTPYTMGTKSQKNAVRITQAKDKTNDQAKLHSSPSLTPC